MGKLDQRARCCSSSKANRTRCRCFSVSVARKVFAARTMRAVAVCAEMVVTDSQIAATTAMVRSILMEIRFTLLSLSVILALDEAISRDRKIFQEDRSRCRDFRLSLSTLIDVVFLLPPTPGKEIFLFRLAARNDRLHGLLLMLGAGVQLRDLAEGRSEFCIFKPRIRANSSTLSVTRTQPLARAFAAMSMSFAPIGLPRASRSVRKTP